MSSLKSCMASRISGLCILLISLFCVSCTENNPFIGDKEVFIRGEMNRRTHLFDNAYDKNSFIKLSTDQKITFTEKECIVGDKKYDVEYKKKENNIWSIRNKNNDEWYDFKYNDKYFALFDIDRESKIGIVLADVKAIKNKAEKNDAIAQSVIGQWHKYGMFGCDDWDEAIKYFRRSGEQGNLDAYCQLADMYIYGTHHHRAETQKGLSLYESTAKKGFFGAQLMLGNLYYFGIPIGGNNFRTDKGKAMEYYKLALESNRKRDVPEEQKTKMEKYLNDKIQDIEKEISRR